MRKFTSTLGTETSHFIVCGFYRKEVFLVISVRINVLDKICGSVGNIGRGIGKSYYVFVSARFQFNPEYRIAVKSFYFRLFNVGVIIYLVQSVECFIVRAHFIFSKKYRRLAVPPLVCQITDYGKKNLAV